MVRALKVLLIVILIKLLFSDHSVPLNGNAINKLEQLLIEKGAKFPTLMIAQMLHETGNLSSPVYKECNNCFGMKVSPNRNWAIGWCKGHAKYESVEHSIMDYLEYQQVHLARYEAKYGICETEEDYLDFLKKWHYAEDPDYKRKVLKWIKRVEKFKNIS